MKEVAGAGAGAGEGVGPIGVGVHRSVLLDAQCTITKITKQHFWPWRTAAHGYQIDISISVG